MNSYVVLVQGFSGRDKVLRTAGYAAMLLSATAKDKTAAKLVTFARQISATRTVMRLVDDVPMWFVTRNWSAGEKDWFARLCANASNVASQLYLPLEHIAWAADQKILTSIPSTSNWWGVSTACWAISLFFSIIRSLRKIYLLRQQIQRLLRQRRLESPEKSGPADEDFCSTIRVCSQQQLDECWNLLKSTADFILAVNVLPWKSVLWAGRFSPTKNAGFGTISSVIGLYMLLKAQQKVKRD